MFLDNHCNGFMEQCNCDYETNTHTIFGVDKLSEACVKFKPSIFSSNVFPVFLFQGGKGVVRDAWFEQKFARDTWNRPKLNLVVTRELVV